MVVLVVDVVGSMEEVVFCVCESGVVARRPVPVFAF